MFGSGESANSVLQLALETITAESFLRRAESDRGHHGKNNSKIFAKQVVRTPPTAMPTGDNPRFCSRPTA